MDSDEIQELDHDIKTNGWEVKNIIDIDNAFELLSTFQLFHYNTGRFPLSNELLVVPDGDVPAGVEKTNMKNLYEQFRHIKSHQVVFLQLSGVLSLIFDDKDIKKIKNALTELYRNLSYTTLSGTRNFELNVISELVEWISFLIKGSTLLNRDKQELEDAQKTKEITDKTTFVEKPDPFDQELVDNLFKDLEHKK